MGAPLGNKNHLKHGMRHTRIYTIWRSMRQRCNNHNAYNYHNYGARGIRVCVEWDSDFVNFYNWAMSNGYDDTKTIDRIDNYGNYEPSNCRWVSYKVQNNNRRCNRFIEFNGDIHTLAEWAEISGQGSSTLWARLNRGWSVEKSLTQKLLN